MKFEQIKENYAKGICPISVVRFMVIARVLTNSQYKEITGQDY